jgi:hypothetical protein
MNARRFAAVLGGLTAMGAVGAPAQAAVLLCTGNNCTATSENVLVTSGTGATISGSTQDSNLGVLFSSTTDASLIGGANGQADVSSADGLLNSLTFALTGGATFTSAIFNLFPLPGNVANEATSVIINYTSPNGTAGSQSINTNGQNFIGVYTTAGERLTSVTFVADPITTGIQDLRQLRLGGAAAATPAVPEPATWAMMLFGFGGLGYAMRRRTQTSARIRFA